jgi:selenide,water dikinase
LWHSINDEEVKCGFAVVGTCPKDAFVRNAGAQVGDVIVLTKPLGSGIAVFAHQVGRASDEMVAPVAKSMATLNKLGGQLMVEHGAHAATDVTGFSLLGHMAEIVQNSQIEATLEFDAIPLFEGVAELAAADVLPGAVERNRESVPENLLEMTDLTAGQQAILFGPETSGGLLVFLPARNVEKFVADLGVGGVTGHVIGRVTASHPQGRIRVTTKKAEVFGMTTPEQKPPAASSCCCANEAVAAAASSPDALPAPADADAFKAYMAAVGKGDALGPKYSKLISVALSVMSKCEPCVRINAKAACDAGATEQEIAAAVSLGIAFGGAPVAMFYNTIRQK